MKLDESLINQVTACISEIASINTARLVGGLIAVYTSAFEEYERSKNPEYRLMGLEAEKSLRYLSATYQMKMSKDATVTEVRDGSLFTHNGNGDHSPGGRA